MTSCRVGCFKFPFWVRALGIRIYSSQDCHTASLNGLLMHLSIGWANVVHPPGIRTTSALQFSYLNVFTVLMWSILIHHKKSAMVLPFKYRSEPPLVFYCCLPSICCCTHSDIVRYVEGSPNSHTQTATPLFEENGSFSPVAVAARATVNPLILYGLCGFYSYVLLSSYIVGFASGHVKAHHRLVHVDDVRWVDLVDFSAEARARLGRSTPGQISKPST